MTRGLVVGLFLLLLGPGAQDPAPLRTFHVNNQGKCLDGIGGGTEEVPYCTLAHASTVAIPGDLFLIASERDGSGPLKFLKSGTAVSPIVYRSTRKGGTTIGLFRDERDEDFTPTALANVYSAPVATGVQRLWQTYFNPILVDDPNQSKFTMVDTDGPLGMTYASDEAVLLKQEGTYRRDPADSTRLQVHPFGNRVPSATTTDFVSAPNTAALVIESTTQYNVLDGFRVAYTGPVGSFLVLGRNNRLRNLTIVGHPWSLRGSNNVAENLNITHVISRGSTWLWYDGGQGTAMTVIGANTNNRIQNAHIWHNWNSTIGAESAPGLVIDGAKIHGAPNHCGTTGTNVTVRNAVLYNCQDYFYLFDTKNVVLEHTVNPSGIALQGLNTAIGAVTVRHSIFSGTFGYTSASKPELCQWESVSLLEHSVVSESATIERCADGKAYPIKTYVANCESGAFSGCMTIRNIRYFTDWKTVITGGAWGGWLANPDVWDVTLVPGSPALNIGASAVPTDLLGVSRPQPVGGLSDAGVYEVTEDKPKPVDCVVSDWGAWAATGAPTFANWAQTLTQERTRTVATPPANGGAACPALTETRTVSQPCDTITVTPSLTITCNVAAARKQ